MSVNKDAEDYRRPESSHHREMELLKGEIIRLLAEHADPRGMQDTELREALRRRIEEKNFHVPATRVLAVDGWMGRMAFSLLIVQLIESKAVTCEPIRGIGFFYKVSPLQALAAQG